MDIRKHLEFMTGQRAPIKAEVPGAVSELLSEGGEGLGYGQLNELLLLFGYDRVCREFFQYLVDGTIDYSTASSIRTLEAFQTGIDRFRELSLLVFGNVKFGFKTFATDPDQLMEGVYSFLPVDDDEFTERHEEMMPIESIPPEDRYYLGYLIEGRLKQRLKENPRDEDAQAKEKRRNEVVPVGIRNHIAYLASDHLDIYVATSMRELHEYVAVADLTHEIFSKPQLDGLKLRWFDPTRAYCLDRLDKGLSEALMLKRAKCTLYLAQESDTLGKDSELASTLAQGKPVVAFVPEVDREETTRLLERLRQLYPDQPEPALVLEQLRIFAPQLAWSDTTVRTWVANPNSMDLAKGRRLLSEAMRDHYNKRANTLQEVHPLGVQVNLATGVANGVLVVRNPDDCAELIRRIVTRTMEFEIDSKAEGHQRLREKISGSIYRVMAGDPMLSNAFWNFYLESAE